MTTTLRKALEHPIIDSYVYLVATLENGNDVSGDGGISSQWEPVTKAKITVGVANVRTTLHKKNLLVCSSALTNAMEPYVLEWVNWQLFNGADHIMMYLGDASTKIPDMLVPYARSGLVSFKHWQTPEIRPSVLMSQQV